MLEHEQFEELSALAAIGQLSEGEHRELLAHLKECESCKQTRDDFAFILDQLPVADPPEVSEDSDKLLGESHRKKFLARARAGGLHFTESALNPKRSGPIFLSLPRRRRFLVAAAVAACLAVSGMLATEIHRHPVSRKTAESSFVAAATTPASLTPKTTGLAELPPASTQVVLDDSERQVQAVKQQLALATQERRRAEGESEHLKQQLAQLLALANQNEENYSGATSQLQKLQNEQAQFLAALVEKENKIQELTEQMSAQRASVEREQQLSTAAKDVRELMGARNLHIIDVYDFDARQRRDKSFGRVFYAAGNSLIFYAFDLGQKGPGTKVSFQAWGQEEGRAASAKNLGIFHVDDHAQKTWVLRVDDPQLLSSIDSVFVTIEPSQGADKPSGKKLLYAYLGAQPNHP
jgi:hypothetical protein